ncbi:hypothetical protein L2E82_21805 [Cichorium intybus]|uniref:Uncharacterized protein n=1 Tax=Cichorium intybus TaxID=13427 RepID=A0ACB9DW35_CICIN|nr:hypothetical protein L2E82_21805 [Cichorium intybus]
MPPVLIYQSQCVLFHSYQSLTAPTTGINIMEPPERQRHHHHSNFWFIKLLCLQSDILADCLLSVASPFLSLFSLTSTFQRVDSTKESVDSAVPATPSTAVHGSIILLKKALLGFLGAAYVCWVLITVMVVSVVVGVALVNLWVEEPVYIKENLYFDYTDAHPYAIMDFGFDAPGKVVKSIPVGHICNVRLVFTMPESEYNREIGNFQVVAEALSMDGDIITSASRPCILRFRSRPLRAMQTFLMGVPLLLGMTHEMQTVNVPLLKYKEHYYPRTRSMRLSLIPRAGTPFLPQLYGAKVIVSSELPWRKDLVRKWKWTFYVWTSLYVYLMLLVVLVCGFRSIMFPAMTMVSGEEREAVSDVPADEPPQMVVGKDEPTSETFRRWRQSRSKRKAMLLGGGLPETGAGSDATSMSVTRDEDTSTVTTEEVGDSESVCQ